MTKLEKGTVVARRFVIDEPVGEGGMGTVYRALQASLDREVALKVLHSNVAFTARARRRFGREARSIARLNHPHIASVFDFGTDNDDQTLWLAMEFVDGKSITGLKHEPIDLLRLLSLTDQILSALSAAHARGIIHRDLKPSNILLARNEADHEIIKLVDFGLAATYSDDLGSTHAPGELDSEATDPSHQRVILGTPRYMAPELFQRKPVQPRVDLYALGIILFEILAGTPPYPGDDPRTVMRGHLNAPLPRLRPREGDISPELERCIYKLLAKHPNDRYQSAAEVRDVLQIVLNEFSYVPWMVTGPRGRLLGSSSMGHISQVGFLSGFGGQTIPPSTLIRGDVSHFGPGGAPQAPLVGRTKERRTLERLVRKTISTSLGGIAFLDGEAGIGKSRLLEWIRVRVEEAGVLRVAQGTFTRGRSGFSGVRDILANVLETDHIPPDQLAEHLAKRLSQWSFSGEEAELCLQLLSPDGDSAIFTDPGSPTGLSVQERVFAMLERVFRQISTEKPWLLILEDLHNAGDETLAFLQHLAVGMHLDPMPVIIFATIRSEEIDQVPEMRYALERLERLGPENVIRIKLGRLHDDEAASLVQKLAPIDDDLATQIAARASGNPLQVTQILGYLQDGGKLHWDDGRWSLVHGIQIEDELPEELAEMMRYRLNRLATSSDDAEAVRAILDRAAILGVRFDYHLLLRFLSLEENQPWLAHLDPVLERLVEDGFFREVGTGGRDVLEFAHVVMRDVLSQQMARKRSLRSLHRAAAMAKKIHYGEKYHQYAREFIDHYRHARDPSGVYAFTVKAARAAADAANLKEAMALYRDAKHLADHEPVAIDSPYLVDISGILKGEEVTLEVAHLERRIGDYPSSREHYRRLLDNQNPALSLWARWGMGEISRRQGDHDDARNWFREARNQVKDIWQTLRTRDIRQTLQIVDSYCLVGLAISAHAQGLFHETQRILEESLARSEKIQDRALQARVLRLLTDTYWRRGESRLAEVHFRKAAILEESLVDRDVIANGLRFSAIFLREVGQPKKAAEQALKALEYIEALSQKHDSAQILLTLGELAFSRGDFKSAANYLHQAHPTFAHFKDLHGIANCKLALAHVAFAVDRFKETQTLVLESMDGFRTISDRRGLTIARFLLGRLELALGRPDNALKTLTDTVQHFDRISERRLITCARAYYALALKETHSHGEAILVIEKILEDLPDLALAEESLGAAFDKLAPLIEDTHPQFAQQLRELGHQTRQRLGRTSILASA